MANPKRPAKPLNTAAGQRVLANKKGLTLRRFGKEGIPLAMGAGPRTEDGFKKKLPGPESAAGKSKVRAKAGVATYKAKAKLPRPTPQADSNPLAQIGEALDKIIPTRKWKHPVVPKPRREVNVPGIVNKALGK